MHKTVFVQILAIVLIVGGYFLIDFNSLYTKYFRNDVSYTLQNKNCDLHNNACEVVVGDETFILEVFPKDIPLMKKLRFQLKTSKELSNLALKIYATNMSMGEFNLKFKQIGDNVYEAKGMLPTCIVGNMIWNADLKLSNDVGARFSFQTGI